jgi:hypothetical protein
MHRDEHAVELLSPEHGAVIRVHVWDPEVAGAAAGPFLVDVAAGDELADLAALRELADRSARLGRVRDGEAEARVQVLRRMAPAADEADPDESHGADRMPAAALLSAGPYNQRQHAVD